MNPDPPVILDEQARKAVHAARDAAQQVEITRQVQLERAANDAAEKAATLAAERVTEAALSEDRIGTIVRTQVQNVLLQGTEKDRMLILARVPYVCIEITNINTTLEKLKESTAYLPLIQKLVFGLVGVVLTSIIGALMVLLLRMHT